MNITVHKMKQLSSETVRLLSSAQVITSVLSAVKELVENSLDAGADNVEVKLDNFGLDKVEVRDNGEGIAPDDVVVMGQRHFTSKLTDIGDLASVTSYGFRGEALASLCAVSDVTVTTKRSIDDISRVHTLNHSGEVTSSKPSHLGNGTTITATHLFKTVPVRRQYYSSGNRKKDELKKIEDLFMCYGFINPGVRFALSHNKKIVWQKNRVQSSRLALLNTVGSSVMSQMGAVEKEDQATGIKVSGFLPKLGSDLQLVVRHHSNDRCWIYVNKRPVQLKDVEKLIKQHFCKHLSDGVSVRNLVACLHFELPTETVDVNLEPDKCKVLLQNRDAVLELLTEILEEFYNSNNNNNRTVTKTDSVKNSKTENICEEQNKQRDALVDVNEEETMGKDLNQTSEESEKEVRKFGAAGDIRGQLREESKQCIEAFLFKELGGSGVICDTLDQFGEDSNGTDEIVVSEVEKKSNKRRSSLDRPREKTGMVNGEMAPEEQRNLEMGTDFKDQSTLERNQISKEHVTEENDWCNLKSQYDFSKEQEEESNESNKRTVLKEKVMNQFYGRTEGEPGQRNEGLIGEEANLKINSDRADEPTFTLFEENIFLDTQIVRSENDGDKKPMETENESEEMDVVEARGKQQINVQEDGGRETMHQSSRSVEDDVGKLHPPEDGSNSSVGSGEDDLVLAEAGGMAWSKGVLLGSKAAPVQPVKVLIPGISSLENDQEELNTGSFNDDSAGMKTCVTNTEGHSDMVVRGTSEKNSRCPPLPSLETNSTSNPLANSTVEILNSKGDISTTAQHAGNDDIHQKSINGSQGSGTAVPSANHDKLITSSNNKDLDLAQGSGQKSGEMLAKSLLDKKGNPGENSASVSPKSYYDLVHGKAVKKPQDAYTHFLKEYGPKVGGCFPTIERESMDVLLKETWRQLPEEKKKQYETMAEKDQERYDKHVTDSVPAKRQKTLEGEIAIPNPTRKKKGKKVPLITNQGFIDEMLASQENRQAAFQESTDVIPTKEIPFSVNSLKNFMKESRREIDEDTVSLVGRLASHHIWITLNQSHLSVLHHLRSTLAKIKDMTYLYHQYHWLFQALEKGVFEILVELLLSFRAEEIVLYRRLMSSHTLASTELDVPLTLSESMLGCWNNWLTLLSMKSSPVSEDFISMYTDERLVKNGFKVRRLIDQETRDVRLEITSMSDFIPCYGISDLQEILKKVSKNAAIRLGQCRPLKVTNYLKSEAVRISRNRPSVLIQDDIVDLISSLAKINQHPIKCLHEKPVFHNFFSFTEET